MVDQVDLKLSSLACDSEYVASKPHVRTLVTLCGTGIDKYRAGREEATKEEFWSSSLGARMLQASFYRGEVFLSVS